MNFAAATSGQLKQAVSTGFSQFPVSAGWFIIPPGAGLNSCLLLLIVQYSAGGVGFGIVTGRWSR